MKKLYAFSGIVLLLAGGGAGWWWFRPPTKVEIPVTKKDLQKGDAFPHGIWTKVLKAHSTDGFVDYVALKSDHADLDEYLGFVAKYSPEKNPELFPKREDQLAYGINAYNAYVVLAVSHQDPITGVSEATVRRDFFYKNAYPFGGKSLTLDEFEKTVKALKEPRVHFALNCASLGCPRLPDEAFEPSRIDEQLAREAKKFVNEERNVKAEGGKVLLSNIFNWYQGDFIGSADSPELLKKIREFGKDVPDGEITFVDYDWNVNIKK